MYLYKTVVLPDSKTDIQPSYALKVNPVNLYHNVCHFKNTSKTNKVVFHPLLQPAHWSTSHETRPMLPHSNLRCRATPVWSLLGLPRVPHARNRRGALGDAPRDGHLWSVAVLRSSRRHRHRGPVARRPEGRPEWPGKEKIEHSLVETSPVPSFACRAAASIRRPIPDLTHQAT